MIILKTIDLNKIYQSNYNNIHAISNINLDINQGEFAAITGIRGSGKTTLLRLLGGYDRPSSGKVYLNNKDIYSLNNSELAILYRKEIGFISQNYQLISGLSIYENILLPSILDQSALDKEYFSELTDSLHITNVLNSYPRNITEDQKQCVTIARALINQPEIIFADEPTKNLSRWLGKDILDLLLNYISWNRRTLIMATQDPAISIFADHMIRLDFGKILSDQVIRK
jgi:putative ABC transport system ATP-binding protein